ncbi:MAG: GntR family transcriptional regulator [Trueperaceae bacterium]
MPIPHTESLERPVLRNTVYANLRDWIVQGILGPEEKLKDDELAKRLGVSRTPVREALMKLEDEGLIETSANRWTRVSSVTLKDAERIYPIVARLETLALGQAFTHLTKDDFKTMRQVNQQLQKALEARKPVDAAKADVAFHAVFISRSQNPELIRILTELKLKHERLEIAYFGDASLGKHSPKQHLQIIRLLEQGNLKQALKALEENWKLNPQKLGKQ